MSKRCSFCNAVISEKAIICPKCQGRQKTAAPDSPYPEEYLSRPQVPQGAVAHRWEYFRLAWSGRITITTTDSRALEALFPAIERFLRSKYRIKQDGYEYKLSQLQNRDADVCTWIISWLCRSGWEPYAVHGQVHGTDNYTRTTDIYHFRREWQQPAG